MNSTWTWVLPVSIGFFVFLAGVGIVLALVPLARERREARWHAYAAQCEATGFTEPQCRMLFDATEARADDSDFWMAVAASQLAQSLAAQRR